MRLKLMHDEEVLEIAFPRETLELQDILDRMHCAPGESQIGFEFCDWQSDYMPMRSLYEQVLRADIYKLNLFVQRYEAMSEQEQAVFGAVLSRHKPQSFGQILKMTYGLDSVPVIPAKSFADVGRFCIEHEMLPEIADFPPQMRPLLGCAEVGRMMAERGGGVFTNGIYCEPDAFEMPDIRIGIQKPEGVFFRLLIGRNAADKHTAQWISLPCSDEQIAEMESDLGAEMQALYCFTFSSAIPWIRRCDLDGMQNFHTLNLLARQLAEPRPMQLIKLKAVMAMEGATRPQDALDILGRLAEYRFDQSVSNYSDYAQAYLLRNLPERFDASVLEKVGLYDLGTAILRRQQGRITPYGAVCRGEDLYALLTPVDTEQAESMEMGGMEG